MFQFETTFLIYYTYYTYIYITHITHITHIIHIIYYTYYTYIDKRTVNRFSWGEWSIMPIDIEKIIVTIIGVTFFFNILYINQNALLGCMYILYIIYIIHITHITHITHINI